MRAVIISLFVTIVQVAPARAGDPIDFDKSVAPILASRCLDCHSGDAAKGKLDLSRHRSITAGGKSGPTVSPGKPADSLLWQRVADDEMPPKHPLPAAERAILKDWIVQGAKWGTDPIDPYRYTTSSRAGKDWWSLQPLGTVPPPGTSAHPIDAFLQVRLAARKLTPSPAADRRTLIRRITFDLTGLPPSPEEIDRFVSDRSDRAYEALVDRLLASPHYGERWARHWLDVAHFGESDGFEYDRMRPHAWRYRDWVIRAFNDNMPYDRFARLQLAGDVLQPNDPAALIATGFLVGGAHDSLMPAGEPLRQIMRQDELEDIVGLVGQTFLGLTVHCARCHDHKFDPIPQRDYYRLAAAFAGVNRGDRSLPAQPVPAELLSRVDRMRARLAALEEPALRTVQSASGSGSKRVSLRPIAAWEFSKGLQDTIGTLHGQPEGGARIDGGALVLVGSAYVTTPSLPVSLNARTLEAWVQLDDLEQRGGGVIGIESSDGAVFDAIVFAEREPQKWMAGSNFFVRTQSFGGPAEPDARQRWVHIAITYAADGTIAAYRDGKPYGTPYKSVKLQPFNRGESRIIFGLRHSPAGGNKHLRGRILRARVYDAALSDDDIAASFAGQGRFVPEADLLKAMTPAQRDERMKLIVELRHADEQIRALRDFRTFAVTPKQPANTHVLIRGNPAQRADVVAAGGLSVLPGHELGLPPEALESERRRRIAEWITQPKNPLFARTIVNRVWLHHFGRGLIDTPNDLGFSGGVPSHPELLDWLAGEFVRSGFDLKALHRLIVTSNAYRQASNERPEALAVDAENRLIWRYAPRRLDAESLRDAMLSVSGQLNATVGGPGFKDVRPYFHRGSQFYEPIDPAGAEFHRRTIYRMTARGGTNPLLDTFDCPDPSTATPKRAATTTPLQALSLMNASFTLRMADSMAERLQKDGPDHPDDQIRRAILLTYGRPANDAELEAARAVVSKYGLAPLCRALFNANGFLYVR